MRSFLPIVCTLLIGAGAMAQTEQPRKELVQFSGVVVTGDSLMPVPFTNILIKHSYRGTMADVYGYFSFVAQEGDTVVFSALGFERSQFVIPLELEERKYSMIHQMYRDTVQLPEMSVFPWPSKEQFREAFLNLKLADDDYQLALRNMSDAAMLQAMENISPDAMETFRNQMAMDQTRLYSQGMYPTTNLFNPIAWAQFIQAWRSGKLKRQ